jgi:NTE family protein
VTAGLIPIWKITDNLQLRGETHAFMPIRPIEAVEQSSSAKYGPWISRPHFMAEAAFVFNLPFATLSAYVNFKDHPTADWNFGVSFGLYFLAPRFLN